MTGLSFELTAEQEQLRQMVRDFADREAPRTWRLEASKDFPAVTGPGVGRSG